MYLVDLQNLHVFLNGKVHVYANVYFVYHSLRQCSLCLNFLILELIHVCERHKSYVQVEPTLYVMDTPQQEEHLCYKGHLPESQISCYSYFLPLMRGHLTVKDKK